MNYRYTISEEGCVSSYETAIKETFKSDDDTSYSRLLCDPDTTSNYEVPNTIKFGLGSYDMSDAVGISLDGVVIKPNLFE